jgi:hypothetical protein
MGKQIDKLGWRNGSQPLSGVGGDETDSKYVICG